MDHWSTQRRRILQAAVLAALGDSSRRQADADTPPAVPGIDERIRRMAEEAPLSLQFRGETAEECRAWQQRFADKLRGLLGPHDPPQEWRIFHEGRVEYDDHQRESLVLTAPGHPPLPVYLLMPKSAAGGRRPGVVAVHGHGAFGYDPVAGVADTPAQQAATAAANYDYGRQLVQRGYIVAAPCLTPFGRRLGDPRSYGGQDPCAVTFIRLGLFGKVLMAENLRDVLWAVQLLARHASVDSDRLGCVGLSYGGRMTMLAAALEPRIRVAVISGALNVLQERVRGRYSCGAQVIPGLLGFGDVPEIASLIAPRPCVWEVGSNDGLIDPQWADQAIGRMSRAYRSLGAMDRLQVDRFEGGHRWSGRLAYPLLESVLRPPS